jgi:hypothetical protein
MEHSSVSVAEMDLYQISDIPTRSREAIRAITAKATKGFCSLVSTSCIECVTRSRMMRDCHVRFCEQPRGEIPLG